MTLIVRKLTKKRLLHHNKTENPTLTTRIPKSKISSFEHDLKEVNWVKVNKESDLNHSACFFAYILSDLISKHMKTWKSRPSYLYWLEE